MLNSFLDFIAGLSSRVAANSAAPTVTNIQQTPVLENDSDDDSEYVASDENSLESDYSESDEDNDLESEAEEASDQPFDVNAYLAWRAAQEEEKGSKRLASERDDDVNNDQSAKRICKR